jgi:O-antigen ligase
LVSRAFFLVLFVFFLQEPRDLRLVVGLFVGLAFLTAWSGSSAAITGTGQLDMSAYRAGGLEVLIQSTKNPNRLALVATLAMVFAWEYGQAYQSRRWVRGSALAIALLMVVTVFLSASRGGLIGLVVAGMMLFVRRRGGSGRFLYGLVAIVVGIMLVRELVPEQVVERITNIPGITRSDPEASSAGGGSLERRRYTYEIGLQIWRTAPIVGVGPGNWPYMRFLLDPLHSVGVAHNSYLAALAEGGIISLVLYLTLFYVTVRDLLRCERHPDSVQRAKDDGLHWLLPATRICLIAFLVFSLFGDLWDLVFSYFLIGVAAVLIIRYQPAPVPYPVRRVAYA